MNGWRIGRIGAVRIYADPSLGIIALLVTFNLWAFFSDQTRFPGLSAPVAGGLAVLTAGLFFGSILAHELAHAGMFLARGIQVTGIKLFMFGGVTNAKREAAGPGDEFLVAAVGPGTTLALGGIFLALRSLGADRIGRPLVGMFGYLALFNLSMGAFNLLPGFPLDGGRLLLAGLWRVTRSRARATQMAARVGQILATGMVAGGITLAVSTGDFLALWLSLIGWFLLQAATATRADVGRRRILETALARDIMSPPPPAIPAELSVDEAVREYLAGHEGEAFPVIDDGHVVGFVSLRTARGIPHDQSVRNAMTDTTGTVEAAPNEPMGIVSARLGDYPNGTVLVMEDNRLVGVIEPADITRYMRLRRRNRAPL
jgi:Zn-dependent protease